MKKIVCIAGSLAFAGAAFSQGTIAFSNGPGQELTNQVTGFRLPVGNNFFVGLYYAPQGTVDARAFALIGTTSIAPIPGRFSGGTIFTPSTTAPGGIAALQVRAWSSPHASYEMAYTAALAGDSSVALGTSLTFEVQTGNAFGPNVTPPASIATPDALNPFPTFRIFGASSVPEPLSVELVGLALFAFTFFARRKS